MRLVFSVVLFILITILAWPVFTAVSFAVSYGFDILGFQDFLNERPKRLWLNDFLDGWLHSAPFSIALAAIAVLDMQLLTRHKFTYLLSGISLPIALVVLGMVFLKQPNLAMMPVLAITGLVLWIVYRIAELISRYERG